MSDKLILNPNDLKTKADDFGLRGFEHKDNKTIYHHLQDVDPVLEQVHKEKMGNDSNGFTDQKTMRKIGSIPFIEFLRNPILAEAVASGDPEMMGKAMELYLKSEGKQYATVTKGI